MSTTKRISMYHLLISLVATGTVWNTSYAQEKDTTDAQEKTATTEKEQSVVPPTANPKVDTEIPQKDTEAPADTLDQNRREYGVLPALTYDSDLGFGLGAIGNITQFAPASAPFKWQLQFLVYMTLKESPDGGVEAPFHDYYLIYETPHLLDGLLRLRAKAGFGRYITAGYFGIGNASTMDDIQLENNKRYYQYDKISPYANINARIPLARGDAWKLDLFVEPTFSFNVINIYEGSRLQEDLAGDHGTLTKDQLFGTEPHAHITGTAGVLWDSRNHEAAPSAGLLSQASVRGGGGIGDQFAYFGINLEQRAFYSLWKEYLVLAGRVLFDNLFGQVPIYELPRFGGYQPDAATGGEKSIRGIPGQRFAGKVKLLANFELRSKFLPFTIVDQRFNLGGLAFFDAGRIFSDYQNREELDGSGLGLKTGVGGGLRLQWGEYFIVRCDFGYSPSEGTTGLYISIDHVF